MATERDLALLAAWSTSQFAQTEMEKAPGREAAEREFGHITSSADLAAARLAVPHPDWDNATIAEINHYYGEKQWLFERIKYLEGLEAQAAPLVSPARPRARGRVSG